MFLIPTQHHLYNDGIIGFCGVPALSAKLCIEIQNLSIGVNVVNKGSPSRIFKVLRISLGITILPKSSTRRTIPVAMLGALVADGAAASLADRGHSLRSLHPPPAALPSLPGCLHNISFSFSVGTTENRVIARALAPVAIRIPCRQRRRGALHRKKTDSHDQFANWSRNDRGGCPHPPENISDGTMWASSPTIILPQDLLFALAVI